jgi:hypothetical protein
MKQDELFEIAHQASKKWLKEYPAPADCANPVPKRYLEIFAELVEAKASAKEREACASINFRMCLGFSGDQCYQISELIRARGEQQ